LKIFLFGSCVTRDIFSGNFFNGKDNITIDYSFSRISLISLNSLPLNIDVSGIELIGPHQRRALADDLNKTVYPFMSNRKGKDVLLIDFVDERFHQWGLGAMHYEQAYYDACMSYLLQLEKLNSKRQND